MNLRVFTILLLTGFALCGCQTFNAIATPTAESLGDDFAGILGVKPGQVQVSDIESKNNKTYFTAKTVNGTYNCATDSGALVAIVSPTIGRTCTPVGKEK